MNPEEKIAFLVEVTQMLNVMRPVLKYAPHEITEGLANTWARVLYEAHVNTPDVMPAAYEWMRCEREFPTPSDLLDVIEERRAR